jgi:hypothetical protein
LGVAARSAVETRSGFRYGGIAICERVCFGFALLAAAMTRWD